jgi:hypothetical protein
MAGSKTMFDCLHLAWSAGAGLVWMRSSEVCQCVACQCADAERMVERYAQQASGATSRCASTPRASWAGTEARAARGLQHLGQTVVRTSSMGRSVLCVRVAAGIWRRSARRAARVALTTAQIARAAALSGRRDGAVQRADLIDGAPNPSVETLLPASCRTNMPSHPLDSGLAIADPA